MEIHTQFSILNYSSCVYIDTHLWIDSILIPSVLFFGERVVFSNLPVQNDSDFLLMDNDLYPLINDSYNGSEEKREKSIRNLSCRGHLWSSIRHEMKQFYKHRTMGKTARKRWTLEAENRNLISSRRLIIRLNHFNFRMGTMMICFFCLARN